MSLGAGSGPRRPTREELAAAAGKTVPDVLGPDCSILFCGINPGLYTAAVGHHFARPGNRFWKALALSGLTDRLLDPSEEQLLVPLGIGITNLVARATATAAELTPAEIAEGGALLRRKVATHRPRIVAMLGAGAWRSAFDRKATIGRQAERLEGAVVFVLPNPSGLQAAYQLPDLAKLFAELAIERDALERGGAETARPQIDPAEG